MDFAATLLKQANDLGVVVSSTQCAQLEQYWQLLIKWNKAYNLTAVRDPLEMIERHFADSLSIASLIKGQRILDVGTGAGFPGMVLAILFTDKQFTLLDSNGKKTRFLNQVESELGLSHVTVAQARVETYQPNQSFDVIVSRAFSELANMVQLTAHLLAPSGYWLAMKGKIDQQELSALPKGYKVQILPLKVPDTTADRHAVMISQEGS